MGASTISLAAEGAIPGETKPCADVLYDPEQLDEVEVLEAVLDERLAAAEVDSPLRSSLEAQKRSVENYRHVIRQT